MCELSAQGFETRLLRSVWFNLTQLFISTNSRESYLLRKELDFPVTSLHYGSHYELLNEQDRIFSMVLVTPVSRVCSEGL